MASLGTLTTTTAARIRPWTITATAALGWAVVTLTIMHLVSSYDPVRDPLSRYAFADHGEGMLEAGLVSFAVGVLAVCGALNAAGLALPRMTVLAGMTTAGLVTATLFPATYTVDIDPASGRIHQYASVLAFVSLPAIGFSLLDRLRDVPGLAAARTALVRVLLVGVGALGLFGLAYVVGKLPVTPATSVVADVLPVGLTQRIVFVADVCLLAVMLAVANRAARAVVSAETS